MILGFSMYFKAISIFIISAAIIFFIHKGKSKISKLSQVKGGKSYTNNK
jgi:hypothetical protein